MDRFVAMSQFVRVVEAGSFSAAARILGQGQPAISKTVAQLEERLGTRLLSRTTRSLTLTDAGRTFYDRAKVALDAAEDAESATKGAAASLQGRLRICAPVTFARLHLIPALSRFIAAHPELELDLILDDRRIDLVEEGIDLAIRAGDLSDSGMVAQRLAQGRRQVVAAPTFWQSYKSVRVPADLKDLPFVAFGPAPGGLDWVFAKDGKTSLLRCKPCMRVSAQEGLREAVFAGLGFAVLSEWSASDALARKKAETRLDKFQLPAVDLWAIYPAGRQTSLRARVFTQFVQGLMQDMVRKSVGASK